MRACMGVREILNKSTGGNSDYRDGRERENVGEMERHTHRTAGRKYLRRSYGNSKNATQTSLWLKIDGLESEGPLSAYSSSRTGAVSTGKRGRIPRETKTCSTELSDSFIKNTRKGESCIVAFHFYRYIYQPYTILVKKKYYGLAFQGDAERKMIFFLSVLLYVSINIFYINIFVLQAEKLTVKKFYHTCMMYTFFDGNRGTRIQCNHRNSAGETNKSQRVEDSLTSLTLMPH